MSELIGGRYRTEDKLGAGGMGTVYAATDTVTGARVAVKVVGAQVAENEVLLSRFEREVRAVRALETPHVVRTLDAGRDPYSGLPFFVMEVLEGDDVAHVIKRLRPLRPDLALRICAQACAGLEVAHAARIVHRDIKPSNLFLTKGPGTSERTVKILDFGIAKLVPEQGSSPQSGEVTSLTETGSMLGSPLYMAPEQARGHRNIDTRADIWSLGVVLYQALTGRTPHPYTDALGELIIAICTEPAERVEKLAPWVPKKVAEVVHRALEINPAARFQTMSEMRAAIVACLPDAPNIDESMIVTMPESERTALATSAGTNGAGNDPDRYGIDGRTISEQPTQHWAGANTGANTPAGVQLGPVTQPGSSGFGSTTVVAKRPHTGILVASVLAFAAFGGVAAFLLFGGAASSKDGGKPTESAQVAAVAAPKRVVRVNIEPAEAEVSVNGRAVQLQDGAISIEGTLGSSHVVRVSANGRTETKDVIVAEHGAAPDRVAVAPATTAAPSATALTGPVKKGTTAPRTSQTNKPPTSPPGEIYLGR
jgi:serine/threonine protein kinase